MRLYYAEGTSDSLSITVSCENYKKRGSNYIGDSGVKVPLSYIGVARMGTAVAKSEEEAVALVRKWYSDSATYHAKVAEESRAIAESDVKKTCCA